MKNLSVSVIREWLYVVIAFLMPFMPRLISVAIGLSFICWVIELFFLKKKPTLKFQKVSYIFLAFYFTYVAGLLWTDNFGYGFFDLQIKLSMIVFPLMFFSIPLPGNNSLSRIIASFNFGCLVSVIIVIGR